jgi:hypothetical protein
MTKDEALKLALEALEINNKEWKYLADSGDSGLWNAEDQDHYQLTEKAIIFIKEALETKNEFVAWEQFYPDIGKPQIAFNAEVVGYVAPQRTWAGLTDEEIETIYAECNVWDKFEYERMLEAKLKEKNT